MKEVKLLWVVWYTNGARVLEFMSVEEKEKSFPKDMEDVMAVWPATEKDVQLK